MNTYLPCLHPDDHIIPYTYRDNIIETIELRKDRLMTRSSPHVFSIFLALLLPLLWSQLSTARPHSKSKLKGYVGHERGAKIERELRRHLIPPHLLLRHMDRLALSEKQKEALKTLMKNAQAQMIDMRFELQKASKELIDAVKEDSTPQSEILKQADELMEIEAKHKRARLQVALKVRDLLTPEQRKKAKAIKAKMREKLRARWKKGDMPRILEKDTSTSTTE